MFALALLGVGVLLLLYGADADQPIPWFGCPLRRWTGLLCPGCGATRSLRHLLHGDIWLAIELNPLVIAALPGVCLLGGRALVTGVRGQRPAPLVVRSSFLWALVGLVLLLAVWRNI